MENENVEVYYHCSVHAYANLEVHEHMDHNY